VFSTTGSVPPGVTIGSDGSASGAPSAAGTFTFEVHATTNDGCTGSTSFTVTVAKGTPAITWPAPASIVYGTPLSATQLNATSSVPQGSFTYAPPAGTVLLAGNGQVLSVSFAPADSANYDPASASVTIDVARKALAVTANNATREFGTPNPSFTGTISGIVNGDAITATYATTATITSAPGMYAIVPTLVDPGGRLSNYDVAIANGTLTIVDTTPPVLTLPANITATAATPAGAVVTFIATATDLVDGTRPVTCTPASGSTFPVGTTTVGCSASDTRGNAANGSFTVTVNAPNQPGRMTADAIIDAGAVRHSVAFLVVEGAQGRDAGALLYTVRTSQPGPDRVDVFETIAITSVAFYNLPGVTPGSQPRSGADTAAFGGTIRRNGHSGYTFTAVATDAGEPGARHDLFAITIRDSSGTIVASVNAAITAGNVQSLPAK